jgi:AAA15 family ATPase/GTPase
MKIELTLKNYRCFSEQYPARIHVQKGFTAFLGINNSGKSSLLKFFYEYRGLFDVFAQGDRSTIFEALKGNPRAFNIQPTITDQEETFSRINQHDLEIRIRVITESAATDDLTPKELIFTVPRATNTWRITITKANGPVTLVDQAALTGSPGTGEKRIILSGGKELVEITALIEACRLLSDTFYIGAFRNALNLGSFTNYHDIKIGQEFIAHWRSLKTGENRKQNEATYSLTEDIRRIFAFDSLEINPASNDHAIQVFINGKSFRLSELGSGISQFILVLANVAVRRPSYILIDEPELNLHPSLQIDFMTTLASYAKQGILFATHSYGLARASGDLVYTIDQLTPGMSQVRPIETTPRLAEFLGELSFSGYKELGFEGILLVEGVTEVKTLHQFLRMLKKDHQIVLLPLGGDQLIRKDCETELLEVMRISPKVSALIDSERESVGSSLNAARSSFLETCKEIGINCHILERRSLENYFSDAAVKAVKKEKYRALSHFEKLEDVPMPWAKAENWRIAREMIFDDIKETDLGKFLDGL